MKNNKLVIVGTMAFDEIITPTAESGKILGGAATYIGLAAAFADADIAAVSVVGEDFTDEHLNLLSDRGINISGVERVSGGKSFYWKGKYHDNMNKRDTLDTQLNVLADFNPVVPEAYRDASIVMLGNLDPNVQQKVLDQLAPNPNRTVLLDTMNFWMDLQLNTLLNVIKQVDIITINDEEALQLSGEANLVLAAKAIHKMGPAYVIIKKGEHGALLFYQDQPFFAPALPLEKVVDPTGAGDSFAGGLSGYLAAQQTTDAQVIKAGILHGTAAASLCVATMGTTGLVQSSKEDFLVQLHKLERLRTIST
ncbi:MAG: Bifunctional ribokinase/ribose-5-phosphate isomerase A [Bacteroidota bacterium]|nr:MAG: Bifunctional ribokinase/ribose-5-phosphate isomerase A [Bacteroidota bacterium]